MNSAKRMAYSSMSVALCVLLMFLGAVLELGVYAAPMLCGVIIAGLSEEYSKGTSLSVFAATAILCLILVPNIEENLMFTGILGWYPLVRDSLQSLILSLRITAKAVLFNGITVLVQMLLMKLIMPEILAPEMIIYLLILANITFFLYDYCLPKMVYICRKRLLRIGK